jgi:hypothetical protein
VTSEVSIALSRIREEASAATVYFHTWWALTSLSKPTYLSTMNNYEFVDFFHAANSGFFKLIFVSIAKLFDADDRTLGVRGFEKVLSASGHSDEASTLKERLAPHTDLVKRILRIRNRSVSHNETAISRDEVYDLNGVTPDEIRNLISEVRNVLNEIAEKMGAANSISEGERSERAVLALLEQLRRGASAA